MTLSANSRKRQEGISLVEVVIGLAILVITASVVLFALNQMNQVASLARLYTAAQYLVQSRIDQIQSDTPFIPQNSEIPSELILGTTTQANIPIYTDPSTNNTIVTGTLTSTVTNVSNTSLSEYAYQALVQLNYTYRSKTFTVAASTIRGADQ